MSKLKIGFLAIALACAGSSADAGIFKRHKVVATSTATPTTYAHEAYPASTYPTSPHPAQAGTTHLYPYSYYVARTYPAREYVGLGGNDFPFYGVPYGHPYDPWTWPYMSGSYSRGLARYYDPPVK